MNVELKNLGTVNRNRVMIDDKVFYFSYETVVAFGQPVICCENSWGKTTGKLLNELEPDHKKRLGAKEFEKQLEEYLKG